jgi:hypothetical protein
MAGEGNEVEKEENWETRERKRWEGRTRGRQIDRKERSAGRKFVYGIIYDAIVSSGFVASNGRMISDNDVEGSGLISVCDTVPAFE